MSDTPPAGNNLPIDRSAPYQATSERPQFQMAQERRRALIIICGILFVAGFGVMLIAIEFTILVPNSSHTASAVADNTLRTAKVTIDSVDGNGCQQQVFDNQTWRMTRTQQPCNPTARDSNGVPIPLGTIHRLDAISKSFSGK